MKLSAIKQLIREEVKSSINEASGSPFQSKLDLLYAQIDNIEGKIDKLVQEAIKSIDLEIKGGKAIFTRNYDGKQFITTKTSNGHSERTIKMLPSGKVWGLTRNMTLEKIKFAIALDNPNANPD